MKGDWVCWKCGASVAELPQPLSRRSECLHCRSELHVCRMCEYFDSTVSQQCREPLAEYVADKTRANFCDYFSERRDAWRDAVSTAEQDAIKALRELFGEDRES